MGKRSVLDLGNRIHLIDLMEGGVPNRTGSYVIDEEALTIVETGTSPSIPYILQGLTELGLRATDVKYIILTHIHLDHGGGAGLLLQHCPNATLVVHPRAARHMIDPSRLIAGAKMVYGSKFDEMFHPILEVPEDRLIIKDDGDTLAIGPDRILTFFDTPGHAAHHFSIYDPTSHGMFSGDAAGTQMDLGSNTWLYLPALSPNQLDPGQMLEVIEQFRQMNLDCIYFGHFGMTKQVDRALVEVKDWIPQFVEVAKRGLEQEKDDVDISRDYLELFTNHLNALGIPADHTIYETIQNDLHVYAMGVVDYLQRSRQEKR